MEKFNEIKTFNCLEMYMNGREYKHTHYFHYSDIEGINGILSNKKIWISSMMYSNDGKEKRMFGEETYRYFQLCFSTGMSENLPLWFLYSGTNGEGARISFKKTAIKKLFDVKSMKLKLVETAINKEIELRHNENCKVSFKDILYRQLKGSKCKIIHNCVSNFNLKNEDLKKYEEAHKGFVKDSIWFYEKEVRILVKVEANLLNKALFYEKNDSRNGYGKSPYRIELQIPDDVYSKIEVTLSPKYTSENIASVMNKPGFEKLLTDKIMSEYQGQIDIDLCKKCNK